MARFHWLLRYAQFLLISASLLHAQKLNLIQTFPSASPCSGLFHSSGFSGCSSKKESNLNVGEIRVFEDYSRFSEALESGTFRGSWIIPTTVWCQLSRSELAELAVYATSLLIVEGTNASTSCPPSGSDPSWNRLGRDILTEPLPYPVTRLSKEDSLHVLAQASGYGSQQIRFEFYMGKTDGSINSSYCLEHQKCNPLGGVSAWSVIQSQPLAYTDDVILLTANMDSKAFFHDLTFGFHAAGGDITVALAATLALAKAPVTSTRILTAIFQGEAFERIGSRRFVEDVLLGKCLNFSSNSNKTCADPPNFSLEFTKFQGDISRFKRIVALSNVLRMDGIGTSFISGFDSPSNESLNLGLRLKYELDNLGWVVPIPEMRNETSLPPSALSSFVERNHWSSSSETGGIVLSGYLADISEANPHFETENDVLNMTLLENHSDHLALVATAVARTLFFLASNGTESNITADRGLVRDLLLCFGRNLTGDCPLALNALNLTSSQLASRVANSALSAPTPFGFAVNQPLSAFSGVYFPLSSVSGRVKLRELLIRNILANLSLGGAIPSPGDEDAQFFSCSSDVTCRDTWDDVSFCPGPLASNASVACVGGRCVCSGAFFHEAWSPSLVFNPRTGAFRVNNTLLDSAIWTEPFWEVALLNAFVVSSSVDLAVSLAFGILLTLGTALLIQLVKNREGSLGKVKFA